MTRFRLGLATGTDPYARERIEPFRLYLEEQLDLPVDLFLYETLGETAAALANNRVDYARLSPTAFAALAVQCNCVASVATARPDAGPGRFYSVLLTTRERAQYGLEGLRHGVLAVGESSAVTTRQIPLAILGASVNSDGDFFAQVVTMASSRDGVAKLRAGKIQALAGWSTLLGDPATGYSAGTLRDLYLAEPAAFSDVAVVWQSPALPYTAHVVRKELPLALRRSLQKSLLDLLSNAPEVYAAVEPEYPGGLEPTANADYDGYLAIMSQAAE